MYNKKLITKNTATRVGKLAERNRALKHMCAHTANK